jgi:hypothetical protein
MPEGALRNNSMPPIYFIYESWDCPLRFSLLLPGQCHDTVLVMNTLFFLSADLSFLINQR